MTYESEMHFWHLFNGPSNQMRLYSFFTIIFSAIAVAMLASLVSSMGFKLPVADETFVHASGFVGAVGAGLLKAT